MGLARHQPSRGHALSPQNRINFRDGFLARSQSEELKCPGLELNVLQSIEDVTARVNAAVKKDMKPAEAFAARQAIKAAIEKESLQKTGLPSDVVTLYHGGLCHLYRYKRYTDVRLVMAPEQSTLYFGSAVTRAIIWMSVSSGFTKTGDPPRWNTISSGARTAPPKAIFLCSSPAIRALPTAWKRMTSSCIAVM